MNERIKQLAEQCRWQEIVIEDGEEWIHAHFLEQKFAELIVRECADVCRDDGRWFQEQDDKVEAGVAYALAYKIEDHFGVKK